jgi:hypothetical protein
LERGWPLPLVIQTWPLNAEFDIFAPKLVQVGVYEIVKVTYKPIATIDQSNLRFTIPADTDFYIDPDTSSSPDSWCLPMGKLWIPPTIRV